MARFWPKRKPKPQDGTLARQEAEGHLHQARAQRPEVTTVSESLRQLRTENHFADKITGLIQGGNR